MLSFVQAEEDGVDDFVFVDQGRAGQNFAFELMLGGVANGGEMALFGSRDFVQELTSMGRDAIWGRGLLLGFKQALQGVAANQFLVDFGVGTREGDHVHPGRGAANEREQTDLVWDRNEDFIALAQVVFPGFKDIVHGGGGGWGAGSSLKLRDALPNFALV